LSNKSFIFVPFKHKLYSSWLFVVVPIMRTPFIKERPPMTEDQAKARFMVLNLVRLMAIGFVIAGLANVQGKLWAGLSPGLGYVLAAIGVVDFFFAPKFLKKYWQNEDQ
jgi:hypothetical protein